MFSINVVFYDDVGIYTVSVREDGIHESVRRPQIAYSVDKAKRDFLYKIILLHQCDKDREVY